jgi:3-oxoacyl-[acyl-carrier-protein] synthase II
MSARGSVEVKKRIVITGVGPVTPIGIGKKAYWEALMRGQSGARVIDFAGYDMEQYSTRIACPVEGFSLENHVEKTKESRYLGRTSQFAIAGARLALEDAGLDLEPMETGSNRGDYTLKGMDPSQVGVILGVGVENMDLCEKFHRRLIQNRGPKRISPFALPHIQIAAVPGSVSKKFGIKGATMSVSTACASGTHAVIQAYKQILLGQERVIITGGCDACITPYVFGGFDALGAMSRRNEAPQSASRPFDKDRDGFVLGEGSGVILLEEWTHARARGANIYCEIAGYGSTSDAYHITAPEPSGEMQAKAMKDALRMGNVSPEEIDYVNAHGTSTPLNDVVETVAIKKALGPRAYEVPVSSTKSMTGHLIGGSGGIEIIATALMIERGKIHPTINFERPGEACDLNYVPGRPIEKSIHKALKNSFAFGGQNASLLLQRLTE